MKRGKSAQFGQNDSLTNNIKKFNEYGVPLGERS